MAAKYDPGTYYSSMGLHFDAGSIIAKVVLFDIDGTLLWTDGAGRRALHAALGAMLGEGRTPTSYLFDGKTDRQIVRDLMRMSGHEDDFIEASMEPLLARYLEGLNRELAPDTGRRRRDLLPGVAQLLDRLETLPNVVLGLLTGNIAAGAAAKLRAVGLNPDRFRVCAYGSDHEERRRLPAVALERARVVLGQSCAVEAGHLVVIGDTPADIDCGRFAGARTVAVATGRYSIEELLEHEPDAAFPDFRDTEAVLRAVMAD